MRDLYPVIAACAGLVLLAVVEHLYEVWRTRAARIRNISQEQPLNDSNCENKQ